MGDKIKYIYCFLIVFLICISYFVEIYAGPMDIVSKALGEIDTFVKQFISAVLRTTLSIMRIAYTAMIAVGILLWATGIEPYKAKKLIIGALVLAAAVESIGGI